MKKPTPLLSFAASCRLDFQLKPPSWVGWSCHHSFWPALMIGLTEEGAFCRLSFAHEHSPKTLLKEWQEHWPATVFAPDPRAPEHLSHLFEQKQMKVLKLWMTGTPFQHKVWRAIAKIPRGQTRSYGALALALKSPQAVRAVGRACGANPIPLLVPCHRVVAVHGGWGGFAGGLALKKKILNTEGIFDPCDFGEGIPS